MPAKTIDSAVILISNVPEIVRNIKRVKFNHQHHPTDLNSFLNNEFVL